MTTWIVCTYWDPSNYNQKREIIVNSDYISTIVQDGETASITIDGKLKATTIDSYAVVVQKILRAEAKP